jgi:hypothetical protein
MIHFLRNNKNRTIIECETTKNDLSCAVDLELYSKMLLEYANDDKQLLRPEVLIEDFSRLYDLRRIWFENDPEENESIDDFVKQEFEGVALLWDLCYVTD